MENLEVLLINLFMLGETSSTHNKRQFLDTTIISCEGFKLEFKQLDINLKQNEFINQNLVTTKITIRNIRTDQVEQVLEIIDDLCFLLSFAQQSPVRRYSYKIGSREYSRSNSGIVVNPKKLIIKARGQAVRSFIEQAYPTFKKIKSARQLTVVFDYLCEANRSSLALEISLISHYVAIENLKNTFAIEQGYKYKDGKFSHNLYGKCSSTEMTKRMFEAAQFNREDIIPFLKRRNKIIHEGVLLPFGDENYMEQAINDQRDVSDLLRTYLLTLLNYKGEYFLSKDTPVCSVCII